MKKELMGYKAHDLYLNNLKLGWKHIEYYEPSLQVEGDFEFYDYKVWVQNYHFIEAERRQSRIAQVLAD